jgi:ABC-type Fe3+/spermidine/putrescine transport system ATPase subunit
VYEEPATAYVADFLGVANVLTARPDGPGKVRLDTFTLRAAAAANVNGHDVRVVIRPERVRLEPHGAPGENRIPGMVERLVYVGATTQVSVRLASGHTVEALITNDGDTPWAQGSPVAAHFPAEAVRILSESE